MNRRMHARRSRAAGFTLVELMVVVVIVTILALIAIPSYNAEIRKSRRTEAKTAVLELASREEKYFSTANSYTTDPAELGYSTSSSATFPQPVGEYYQISVKVPDPNSSSTAASFLITATPLPGSAQTSDSECTSFSVTQTGVQSATGTLGDACWQ